MRFKKIEAEVLIEKLQFPNKGIGFYNDKKVTVKNSIPGQVLRLEMVKKRGAYSGNILEVIEKANYEVAPKCCHFGQCGGCTYQNISYEKELEFKEKMVLEELNNEQITDFKYTGIVSRTYENGYRNKMEYSFGDEEKDGNLSLGLRKRKSFYEVVNTTNCQIVHPDFIKILQAVLDYFIKTGESFHHKKTHIGALRHLVIRRSSFTDEILVNLITSSQITDNLENLGDILKNLDTKATIVGFLQTVNDSLSDVVHCDNLNVIWGRPWFFENILGLKFKISPFSFFQTNSVGCEDLYNIVKEFVGDCANKVLFDLYCGTGTIGQILSSTADKIYGIEIVEEAVASAKENCKLNNITNCEFLAGDVAKIVETLPISPDIIVVDPPRDGLNNKCIEKLIEFNAKKIVYVSCKPTSLARDLRVLVDSGYVVDEVRCCDMFPRTYHVETVVLLSRVK